MLAQLYQPLRLALVIFAAAGLALGLAQPGAGLGPCCAAGSLALVALARWPKRAWAQARYPLALIMLVALAWTQGQIQGLGDGVRVLLTALALGCFAGFGLRRPKAAPDKPGVWNYLGLLGLFALWAALGVMGGSLCGLVWPKGANPGAGLIACGVYTLVFHHAQFYLRPPPPAPERP